MVQSMRILARLLASFTILTIFVNVVLLAPPLDQIVHENHYFFSEGNHMYRSSSHNLVAVNNATSRVSPSDTSTTNGRAAKVTTPKSDGTTLIPRLSFTEEEGRRYILDIFHEAGVDLTPDMESQLPTWKQVQEVVGDHPHILNLQSCPKFRENVPPLERMLGASGMFNTGTNLVTHLLKQNCEIPERREKYGPGQSKESYGMRWQVPVSDSENDGNVISGQH
jgi:hypothetical protein